MIEGPRRDLYIDMKNKYHDRGQLAIPSLNYVLCMV